MSRPDLHYVGVGRALNEQAKEEDEKEIHCGGCVQTANVSSSDIIPLQYGFDDKACRTDVATNRCNDVNLGQHLQQCFKLTELLHSAEPLDEQIAEPCSYRTCRHPDNGKAELKFRIKAQTGE